MNFVNTLTYHLFNLKISKAFSHWKSNFLDILQVAVVSQSKIVVVSVLPAWESNWEFPLLRRNGGGIKNKTKQNKKQCRHRKSV